MRIPPNSEIALQSAKIVKNHLMVVDRANSGYCHYFGVPVGEGVTEIDSIESSTSTPFFGLGGVGEAFAEGRRNQVNTEDFADDLQASIKEIAFHPALIGQVPLVPKAADATIDCDPLFDTAGKFSGYKWDFTQQTANSKLTIDNTKFSNISAFPQASFPFSQAGDPGIIESTDKKGFQVRYDHKPIAQNAGEVIFDFRDANLDQTKSPFVCGLSRINTLKQTNGGATVTPTTYNVRRSAYNGSHFQRAGNLQFADVCVARAGNLLYVYQSGVNSNGNDSSGDLCMNEVIYYGAWNANFPAGSHYNIRTTMANEKYVKVKFVLENEHISIFLGTDADAYKLLCDFNTLHAAGAVKNQCLNPTNCAKWAMYPVMAASVGTGKILKLESIKAYDNYPDFDAGEYHKYQWWGKIENEGLEHWATSVEKRFWNDKGKTVGGVGNDGLLDPKGLDKEGMEGYRNTLILAKSNQYGVDRTEDCNSQQTLGFMGRPVSVPESTSTEVLVNIQSEVVPQLTSGASLFVRLNNFTQMSINARQGTVSKIVAHLPRFDNSGNETGALYFEPNSKTYIDLNNPDELVINSFDVDIVYDNETFCTALNGKTIVCFHIRRKMIS